MEENILSSIAEAEERASTIKSRAQSRAAEIVSAAEKQANEIAKALEVECKLLRENGIKSAEERADADYGKAIDFSRADAARYADELIEKSSAYILDIVGRLAK